MINLALLSIACRMLGGLKQLGRFALSNIVADPTPVDVDYDAHAGEPTMSTRPIMTTHLALNLQVSASSDVVFNPYSPHDRELRQQFAACSG